MINMTDIQSSQISNLLNYKDINKFPKSESSVANKIALNSVISVSSMSEKLSNVSVSLSGEVDPATIEKKLGIDSSKWGVNAVSDNIYKFATSIYDSYKKNHTGEDETKTLENFYNMAKDSIQKGYDEAMKFLGDMPEDVNTLTKATLDRSLEKLDSWFKNGGKEVEDTPDSSADTTTTKTAVSQLSETISAATTSQLSTDELLQNSEDTKNQILDLLTRQGIHLGEAKLQKPFFDIIT